MKTTRAVWLTFCVLSASAVTDAASIKTRSGRLIEGELQGLIVGKRVYPKEIVFVVFKGEDIQLIDERGVLAREGARLAVRPAKGLKFPPDVQIAEDIATSDLVRPSHDQYDKKPAAVLLIGELQLRRQGVEPELLPRIRVKTAEGEIAVTLDEVLRCAEAAK